MNILKRGSRGPAVKTLQRFLHLAVDGIFGPLTEEAVKDFQRSKGLVPDGKAGPLTMKALGMAPLTGVPRSINEIIVHCSATAEGKDFTVAQIRQWHRARNFSDIGYHWVIYRNGSVNKGRDESIAGAHCSGHNTHSIGICYIGGCDSDGKTPKDTRTSAQKAALISLLRELRSRYPGAVIRSHRDFAAKACPSFDATKEYRSI